MIVVTGANGHLGRAVVEGLLRRVPANQLIASARNPQQAPPLAEQGVQVRAGDFADPDGLLQSFAGAGQVLVVSPNVLGEPGRQLSRTAIEAARTVGAHRVLYTSHMDTHADLPFKDHFLIEEFLTGAGLPFTALRHGYYAESALYHIGRGG